MASIPMLKLGAVALIGLGAADVAWINLVLGPRALEPDRAAQVTTAEPARVAVGEGGRKVEGEQADRPDVADGKVDVVAKVDTAKVDTAKVDTAKVDTAKVDTAKVDTAKVDTAKADTSKADTSKADTAKADSGKVDSAKADSGKVDTAKADSGKVDSGKVDSANAAANKPDAKAGNPTSVAGADSAKPAADAAKARTSVYFDSMSRRVGSTAREKLAEVVARAGRRGIIHLEGHADYRGDEGYNVELSKRRVDNAAGVLIKQGFDAARIKRTYVGNRGAGEAPEDELWRDRRVDVWIEGGTE